MYVFIYFATLVYTTGAVSMLEAKTNFFSLFRLERRYCVFFTTLSVWRDHFRSSVMCKPRNLKLFTLSTAVPSMWMWAGSLCYLL
jgi:hypothetical protein